MIAFFLLMLPSLAFAQHQMGNMAMPSAWTVEGNLFLNANLQVRKFRDFHQIESQNWFMVAGMRDTHRARWSLHTMFSAEPFTIRDIGSAQVFQTGETFEGAALIDYQHPHDLLMGLSTSIEWPVGATTRARIEAALVGDPALGPTPYVHRASADSNPTAPLGHHTLDSTHATHGVVTGGVMHGAVTMETSWFRGREPDEDRVRLDLGKLDSYSARLTWHSGAWTAQISGGHLTAPDPTEATDINRYTTSIAYDGTYRGRPLAALVAIGVNREPGVDVTSAAYLAEARWRWSDVTLVYARGEVVDKDILDAGGYDPPGFVHPHRLSRVGALTVGGARTVFTRGHGVLSVGGDATAYYTPRNLLDSYGHPASFHVYLRLQLR